LNAIRGFLFQKVEFSHLISFVFCKVYWCSM